MVLTLGNPEMSQLEVRCVNEMLVRSSHDGEGQNYISSTGQLPCAHTFSIAATAYTQMVYSLSSDKEGSPAWTSGPFVGTVANSDTLIQWYCFLCTGLHLPS